MQFGAASLRLLAAILVCAVIVPGSVALAGCSPSSGFSYLCGQTHPEDLARIPGTRWIVASGFSEGAGLKFIDSTAKILRAAFVHGTIAAAPDRDRFPDCRTRPDSERLNVQGLNLRPIGNGHYRLHAVNHGGRESVEIFDVDAQPDIPALTWVGCVLLPPKLAANSVASYADGTLLVTVLVHPGTTYADFVEGRNTGGVYEWHPESTGFQLIPGTELPGNNGIETAADDSGFFVVAFGRHAVLRYSRRERSAPPVQAEAPGFMPDNIHRDGDRLLTAGMVYDEPACGGVRKVIDGVADAMKCHRGTVVAELDPDSMTFRVVASSPPDPVFNGASAAILAGDQLWLGSYQSDCVAYLTLPWLSH